MFYRIMTVLLATVFIVSGCFMLPEEEGTLVPPVVAPEEIPFRTIVLEKQDLVDDLTVRGAVAPAVMENYHFQEKGARLQKSNYRVGDLVNEGDVLMELVVDHLPETIEYQKLSVANLQADLDGTAKIQALEQKKTRLNLESQRLDYASMQVNADLYTGKEIKDAGHSLSQEELNYQIMQLNHEQILSAKRNTLAIESLRLKDYETSLENSLIRATMPGVVTYVKRMFIGDAITDFDTLISVADISQIQVEYEGSQAHEFQLGMVVELSYRGEKIAGKVIQTPDSVPVEDKALYINTAIFAFDAIPSNYVMGDDVDVKAVLNSKEGIIVLPKEAIKVFGQDQLVYVLEDGEKRERYVQVGIDAGPYVEIVQGLSEGDEVIIN